MGTKREVTFIAELDNDTDSIIAIEYLNSKGVLKDIVLNPEPKTTEGKERLSVIKALRINVCNNIPAKTQYIFCSGALTPVAEYIKSGGTLKALVVQGGFVGDNIVDEKVIPKKFAGVHSITDHNFNLDVESTDFVLSASRKEIEDIITIGENVCDSEVNTKSSVWEDTEYTSILSKYNIDGDKRLYSLLACHEGLCMLDLAGMSKEDKLCSFLNLKPENKGLNRAGTKWGSLLPIQIRPTKYRAVQTAISFK